MGLHLVPPALFGHWFVWGNGREAINNYLGLALTLYIAYITEFIQVEKTVRSVGCGEEGHKLRTGPDLSFICRKAAYTSWPKDTSALFRHQFRIHIDHLSCPDVDESAIGSREVVYGRGQWEGIWNKQARPKESTAVLEFSVACRWTWGSPCVVANSIVYS